MPKIPNEAGFYWYQPRYGHEWSIAKVEPRDEVEKLPARIFVFNYDDYVLEGELFATAKFGPRIPDYKDES